MPKFHCLLAALCCASLPMMSSADCPASPPVQITTQSGDQVVNAAWLEKTLSSRNVVFECGGKETYKPDGSYAYSDPNGRYTASSYRFYDDGTRCIDYSNGPRFDRYVVRDKKLVLINSRGERYEVRVTK